MNNIAMKFWFNRFGSMKFHLKIIALMTVFLFSAIMVSWLWNLLAVPIFAAPVLSYWQTYGLLFLGRFIVSPITFKFRDWEKDFKKILEKEED